jgi:hypothetical protein
MDMSAPIDDDLIPPFSGRPPIPLENEKYPEEAKFGLGNAHVEPYATFWFTAWVKLRKGDYFGLRTFDPDSPVASGIVDEITDHYALRVPSDLMVEGLFNMFGRVVSFASQNESRSEPVPMLTLRNLPGARDVRPWEKFHSNFVMKLRDLPPNTIIDKTIAKTGFYITIEQYLFIRKNDRVRVFYDGVLIEHIISPEQAEGAEAIDILIPPEAITKGNQLGKVGLAFTVINVMGEGPKDEYIYSDPLLMETDLRTGLLPTPFLYVNDEETRQLNLAESKMATIVLEVEPGRKSPAPAPAKRNKIVVVVKTTNAQGVEIETKRLEPVTDLNRGHESIPINYSVFATVPSGFVHLSFEWCDFNGLVIGVSGTTVIFVTGQAVVLPAVTVSPEEVGLVSSALDLTVQIPLYTPHKPEYLETLEAQQEKPGGGLELFTQLQLAGAPGGDRIIPQKALAKFALNGQVRLLYRVNTGTGAPPFVSDERIIEVDGRNEELDAPYLAGVEDGNFDPSQQVGQNATVIIPYPLTKKGDTVALALIGQKAGGSFSTTFDITAATEGLTLPQLEHLIPLEIINKNLGSSFSLGYSVISGDSVLRSKLTNVTVGPAVKLQIPFVPEAGLIQTTLEPRAAIQGATVVIRVTPMRATDLFNVFFKGAYGVSDYETSVAGNPVTNEVSVVVPAQYVAKALTPRGNRIKVGYTFNRGLSEYKSDVLEIDLLPHQPRVSASIDGLENGAMLETYALTPKSQIVVEPWDLIHKNQKVTLKMAFIKSDGTESVQDILTAEPVTQSQVNNGLVLPTPVDELKTAKEGSNISLRLWVNFTESSAITTALEFPTRNYTAKTLPSTLPHPTLVAGSSTGPSVTVPALNLASNVLVNVTYPGMLKTDLITLTWYHQNGSFVSLVLNGLATGTLQFNFASLQVQYTSVNSTIRLKYTIQRGTKITTSAEQIVSITAIPQASLPVPTLNGQASGTSLDRNTFSGPVTLRISPWPLAKAGHRIFVKLSGTGGTRYVVNRVISVAEAANGFVHSVPRSDILAYGLNTWTGVQYVVTFDGDPTESRGVTSPLSQYLNTDSFIYQLRYFVNSTAPWAIGNAGAGVKFLGTGNILFSNPNPTNAGTLLSTTINFNTAHTYQIQYPVWNVGGATAPPPIIAIGVGSKFVLNPYAVPYNGFWITLIYNFTPSANGPQQVTISNYQNAKNSYLYNCWVNISRLT